MKTFRYILLALLPTIGAAACAAGTQDEPLGSPTSSSSTSGGEGGVGGQGGKGGEGGTGGMGGVGGSSNGGGSPTCTDEGKPCNDGKNCTDGDTCNQGVCTGTPKFCPGSDGCHVGMCDEQKGCQSAPGNEGQSCDDKDPCTQAGKCSGGVCAKGPPTDCSFFTTPCSVGFCDPVNGCMFMPSNEGGKCDDGLGGQCSTGVCTAGTCVSQPINDGNTCDDGLFNPCTTGKCAVGSCKSEPKMDGVKCDDFNFTPCQEGSCMAGKCTPSPKMEGQDCDDQTFNPCSQGKCSNGSCLSHAKPEGAACNDNHFCTINDVCTAGYCSGQPNLCKPKNGDPCHTGLCNDNAHLCQLVPGNDGAVCDDNNLCSSGDVCTNGDCVGPTPANPGAVCEDKSGCTSGTSCVAGTTTCGNPTTTINMCVAGDSCCPMGCTTQNDADCLYWKSGVQKDVPNSDLIGWKQCFTGTYANFPNLQNSVLGSCTQGNLLLACRPVGSSTWNLVAMAPRADVLFDCIAQDCAHQANGVGWYFHNDPNQQSSWGFAQGGDAVNRGEPCDSNPQETNPDLRVCWGTFFGDLDASFRCGDNNLTFNSAWERAIFQSP